MAEQVQEFCMDSIRELGKGAWRGWGSRTGVFPIGQEVGTSREHGCDQGMNPVPSQQRCPRANLLS